MTHGQKERAQAGVTGDWVCVGTLGAPRGVKGDMRLRSFTENAAAIFNFSSLHMGAGGDPVSLKKIGKSKDGFVVHIEGVSSPEEAGAFARKDLYVPRAEFGDADEDEFYLADLIGLRALDTKGAEIGTVSSFDNFGAEDLLEIVLDEPVKGLGRTIFVPFRKKLVPEIKLSEGVAVIDFALWSETQTSERDGDDDAVDGEAIEKKGKNQ